MHHVSLTLTVTVTGLEHGTGTSALTSAEPRSAAKIVRLYIVRLYIVMLSGLREVARRVELSGCHGGCQLQDGCCRDLHCSRV